MQLVFCDIYYIYQKYKYCLLCGCVLTLKSKSTFNDKLREDGKNTAGGQHKRYNYCNLIAAGQYETKEQILRLIYKTLNNNEIQYKGVGEGGSGGMCSPPHFQKWGHKWGFSPPLLDRPSVLILLFFSIFCN